MLYLFAFSFYVLLLTILCRGFLQITTFMLYVSKEFYIWYTMNRLLIY